MSLFVHTGGVFSNDTSWVVGRWELDYDPNGAKKDWLEFLPNGNVYNIWLNGEKIEGFYIVTTNSVKVVFTYHEKDMIMTFHYARKQEILKIVTSDSGKESIYKKVKKFDEQRLK